MRLSWVCDDASRQRSSRRCRDLGVATQRDPEVLDFAARENWIVVSHDVNTMREATAARLAAGLPMNGLLLVH